MIEPRASLDMTVDRALALFIRRFSLEATNVAFAPGCITLFGDHTEHQNGLIISMAISLITVMVGCKVDGDLSVIWTDFPDTKETMVAISMKKELKPGKPNWANCIKGIVNYVGSEMKSAFAACITTTLPTTNSFYLNSSIAVVTMIFLEDLNNKKMTYIEKAVICQNAEESFTNLHVDLNVYITIMMAKKDKLLLNDCNKIGEPYTLSLTLQNILMIVFDTMIPPKYNKVETEERIKSCAEASQILRLENLGRATAYDIDTVNVLTTSRMITKSVKYVAEEIYRAKLAANALKNENLLIVGDLLTKSHISLRDDYQFTIPETDNLVDLSLKVDGVYGSKMCGPGFGGCVYRRSARELILNIKENYKEDIMLYAFKPCEGAGIITTF